MEVINVNTVMRMLALLVGRQIPQAVDNNIFSDVRFEPVAFPNGLKSPVDAGKRRI